MTDVDLTFLELQDQALHDDFAAAKYRARVKQFLNVGLGEIYRTTNLASADQAAAIVTVTGDASYVLPATSVRVQSLRDVGTDPDTPLGEVSQAVFDRLPDRQGEPEAFTLRGSEIILWPTPDAVYSLELRFRGDAVDMVADADKPALANDYRHLLVSYARGELFALEDDDAMSNLWMTKWEAGLKRLRADLQRRSGRKRRVPSMWAGR